MLAKLDQVGSAHELFFHIINTLNVIYTFARQSVSMVLWFACTFVRSLGIVHSTVACLVVKRLHGSEAKGDLVMIQMLLLFKCKLLRYHAK